jgi:hypothetical protein
MLPRLALEGWLRNLLLLLADVASESHENDCVIGIGAQIRLKSGDRQGPLREVHGGSGYWSVDSPVSILGYAELLEWFWHLHDPSYVFHELLTLVPETLSRPHAIFPFVALELMQGWNATRCIPPLPEADIEKVVASISGIELRRRLHNA